MRGREGEGGREKEVGRAGGGGRVGRFETPQREEASRRGGKGVGEDGEGGG